MSAPRNTSPMSVFKWSEICEDDNSLPTEYLQGASGSFHYVMPTTEFFAKSPPSTVPAAPATPSPLLTPQRVAAPPPLAAPAAPDTPTLKAAAAVETPKRPTMNPQAIASPSVTTTVPVKSKKVIQPIPCKPSQTRSPTFDLQTSPPRITYFTRPGGSPTLSSPTLSPILSPEHPLNTTLPHAVISTPKLTKVESEVAVACNGQTYTFRSLGSLVASVEPPKPKKPRCPAATLKDSRGVALIQAALQTTEGAISYNDLMKLTKWRAKMQPKLGSLFSFLKRHNHLFKYEEATIRALTLPREEEILDGLMQLRA